MIIPPRAILIAADFNRPTAREDGGAVADPGRGGEAIRDDP
jgi:hypothetical protein